ncbi:TraB/GumN family protein [Sphingomonas ginkgonis]|uniref:TraB/GumN family protein n=1 Tax=Sphingomonas ginkgonis TaxID=2315330 RepID=A0A429V9H1_9SPHN|nr:TraB/GumN family protein [Sphingomonas ginkgonis]RST30497.1 TraB/GumN family protein [Sphingomonas ginkgonis]
MLLVNLLPGASRARAIQGLLGLAAVLLALVHGGRALAEPAVPRAPHPALWVVGDRDTTIYLFGTFHALDPSSRWLDGRIRAAFDRSDQLVLETIVPPALMTPTEGPTLVRPATGGREALLSGARQTMSAGRQMGLSTRDGADAVLRRIAEANRKPVVGLEDFHWQANLFLRLSQPAAAPAVGAVAAARAAPAGTLRIAAGPPQQQAAALLSHLLISWNEGDTAGFAQMLQAIDAQSPQTYKALFADRNARWAGWIAERLKQPGVVFVAVGSGHLAGKDSVQAQLAQRGIGAARIR